MKGKSINATMPELTVAFAAGFVAGRYVFPNYGNRSVNTIVNPPGSVGSVTDVQDFASKYKGLFLKRQKDTAVSPYVALTQAIAESSDSAGNFGQGLAAKEANNYFGIKADASWKGPVFLAMDSAGNPAVHWRQYGSPDESINDYFDFIANNSNYKGIDLTNASDPAAQIDIIARGGYGGDAGNYSSFLKQILPQAKKIFDAADNKYFDASKVQQEGLPVIAVLGAVGLLGAMVYAPQKKKSINGAGEWFKEHPLTTSIIAGGIVAVAAGYWLGMPHGNYTDKTDVDMSTLPDPTGVKYKNIADTLYSTLTPAVGIVLSATLLDQLKDLTPGELKAVYKAFGLRKEKLLGVQVGEAKPLFAFFESEMSNVWPEYYLEQMKKVWQPTNLW